MGVYQPEIWPKYMKKFVLYTSSSMLLIVLFRVKKIYVYNFPFVFFPGICIWVMVLTFLDILFHVSFSICSPRSDSHLFLICLKQALRKVTVFLQFTSIGVLSTVWMLSVFAHLYFPLCFSRWRTSVFQSLSLPENTNIWWSSYLQLIYILFPVE